VSGEYDAMRRRTPLGPRSTGTDDKPDRGAFLAVNLDLAERGHTHQVDAIGRHETPGDPDGLDGLVHRPRPDGLNLHHPLFPQDCCQGAGNGLWFGRGGYFEYLHGRRLLLRMCIPPDRVVVTPIDRPIYSPTRECFLFN